MQFKFAFGLHTPKLSEPLYYRLYFRGGIIEDMQILKEDRLQSDGAMLHIDAVVVDFPVLQMEGIRDRLYCFRYRFLNSQPIPELKYFSLNDQIYQIPTTFTIEPDVNQSTLRLEFMIVEHQKSICLVDTSSQEFRSKGLTPDLIIAHL